MKILARVLFLICLAWRPAGAVTIGTDYSDLWWNPSESGWGMNITQQQEVLFIILYVYGTDNKPTWYVGSNVSLTGTNANGDSTFSGPLYSTTGPAFNAPFNPGSFSATAVGTITFTGLADGSSTLSYTVNGALVSKSVVRQTWRISTVTGSYTGAFNSVNSGCKTPSDNHAENSSIVATVTITENTFTMIATFGNESTGGGAQQCTFSGPYSQVGRMGQTAGTYTCTGTQPDLGIFSLTEIQVSPQSLSAKISGRSREDCFFNGQIGGMRRF